VAGRQFRLNDLERKLRKVGSDEELKLLAQGKQHVSHAFNALAVTSHLFDDLLQEQEPVLTPKQ
jgi:hypothetical protein